MGGFRFEIINRGNLDFRNDQAMMRCLRVNVLKSEHFFVLIDDFSRNFTIDDLSKKGCHSAIIFAKVVTICQRNFLSETYRLM